MIKTKNAPVLKVYIVGMKKPFAEMELTDESQVEDFYELLKAPGTFVKYGPIILAKNIFRCAVLTK